MEYFSWRELSTGTTDELNNLLLNNNPHGRTNKGTKDKAIKKFGRNLVIGCIAAFILYIVIYRLRLLDSFLPL